MVNTIPMKFKIDLREFETLKDFKVINLTSVNILCFEDRVAIWTVLLDLKCRFWISGGVSLGLEPPFYILTLHPKIV